MRVAIDNKSRPPATANHGTSSAPSHSRIGEQCGLRQLAFIESPGKRKTPLTSTQSRRQRREDDSARSVVHGRRNPPARRASCACSARLPWPRIPAMCPARRINDGPQDPQRRHACCHTADRPEFLAESLSFLRTVSRARRTLSGRRGLSLGAVDSLSALRTLCLRRGLPVGAADFQSGAPDWQLPAV
jgi:hypothetical protein